jgi:hypothetical protein
VSSDSAVRAFPKPSIRGRLVSNSKAVLAVIRGKGVRLSARTVERAGGHWWLGLPRLVRPRRPEARRPPEQRVSGAHSKIDELAGHLERLVRLFARTCFLWTLLTEACLLAPFDAAFIGAGGCSGEAIPSTESLFLLSANNLKLSPIKLKKRNAIAFCASSPSRAA